MYGPKGTGALYVRRGRVPAVRLQPQMEGGGQERGLRSGTLNVPGIVGFGEAARLAVERLAAGEADRIRGLRDRLFERLCSEIEGVDLNGAREPRLPGNLNVSIAGVLAETLLLSLGDDVALSAGAACAEAGGKGSHVLQALGLTESRIYSAVRFGIGRGNTEEDVDRAAIRVAAAVSASRARSASTLG
jgi:cysteine desulfurase